MPLQTSKHGPLAPSASLTLAVSTTGSVFASPARTSPSGSASVSVTASARASDSVLRTTAFSSHFRRHCPPLNRRGGSLPRAPSASIPLRSYPGFEDGGGDVPPRQIADIAGAGRGLDRLRSRLGGHRDRRPEAQNGDGGAETPQKDPVDRDAGGKPQGVTGAGDPIAAGNLQGLRKRPPKPRTGSRSRGASVQPGSATAERRC